MNTTFIYGLNDPETGECRYVGKADDPHDRLFGPQGHLKNCHRKNNHRNNWIKSLVRRGLAPHLEILQEVPCGEWELWERVWIKVSRKIGMNLVNGTDGGEGGSPMRGRKHSPGAKEKIRLARAKQIFSSESLAKRRNKKVNSSSPYYGVCRGPKAGAWRAIISPKGRQIFLGNFSDEVSAARAYDLAARKYYGIYAKLNFPD